MTPCGFLGALLLHEDRKMLSSRGGGFVDRRAEPYVGSCYKFEYVRSGDKLVPRGVRVRGLVRALAAMIRGLPSYDFFQISS